MSTLIRSEFRKVRTTRSTLGLLGGLLLIVGIATFGTERGLEDRALVSVAPELFVVVAAAIVPMFALVAGIRSVTDEFRNGSIVPTLLAAPRRGTVVVAKVVVAGATGAVFGLLGGGLAIGLGSALVLTEGGTVVGRGAELVELTAKLAAAAAATAVIGVGVGAVIRHQVAAIVGGLAWFLVVENLADGFVPDVAQYLPVHAITAVAGGPMVVTIGAGLGAVVIGAWALAAVAGGVAALARRDVA